MLQAAELGPRLSEKSSVPESSPGARQQLADPSPGCLWHQRSDPWPGPSCSGSVSYTHLTLPTILLV
eukprot:1403557-Pyramimonas_sp.AAC.1